MSDRTTKYTQLFVIIWFIISLTLVLSLVSYAVWNAILD